VRNNIAIIILNYKNYSDTIRCIESILQEYPEEVNIVVVDNASDNGSLSEIEASFSKRTKVGYWYEAENKREYDDFNILLVQNQKNGGYAVGNNVGLKVAYSLGFRYLMVLNNDTMFSGTELRGLTNVLDEYPDALCVGPILYKADRKTFDLNCAKRRATYFDFFRLSYFGRWLKTKRWQKEYYYLSKDPQIDKVMPVDLISGACMMFDAERITQVGYFDEGTFLYYEEDILAEKAKRNGYRFYFQPNVCLVHEGAKTMKNHSHSEITLRSSYSSAVYYLTKWRGTSLLTARLFCIGKYLFMKLYLIKKGISKGR